VTFGIFKWTGEPDLSRVDAFVQRCGQTLQSTPSPEGADTFTFHVTTTRIDPPASSAEDSRGYSRSAIGNRASDGAQVPYQARVMYFASVRGVVLAFQCKNSITFQAKCDDLYRKSVDGLETLQ
jgi:hypothetical protein